MRNSKKEERMLILTMVREGKITVDESIKLLEALNESENEYGNDYGYNYDMEEKLNNFSDSVDNFAREIGDKARTTYRDFEPKLKNVTRTVVEKTVNVLGEITQSLNESLKNMEQSDCDCSQQMHNDQQYEEQPQPQQEEEAPEDNEPREN